MEVKLRKSLVLKIKETQTNKTFMASRHILASLTYRTFSFLHIPLAIHGIFRNWHQLFHNRSDLYKIPALPIFIFFLVYRFHGNIDYLKKHVQPNFTPFPKTAVIFASI